MNKSVLFVPGILFIFLAAEAFAHLDNTSFSIRGGETFTAGSEVQLTWKIAVIHHRTNYIYFSPSTDAPWQLIDSLPEISGSVLMTYTWKVPEEVTSSGRLRIFQSFVAKPGERSNDYTIVSNTFSIDAPKTAVRLFPYGTDEKSSRNPGPREGFGYDLNGRLLRDLEVRTVAGRGFIARKIVSPP